MQGQRPRRAGLRLWDEVGWCGVQAAREEGVGVDVGVVCVVFSGGIVGYVLELLVVVVLVADAVFVVAGVPDFSGRLVAGCERVAAFDELDGVGCGLIHCWRQENVDVVGHDYESVEEEFALVAIAEKGGDEEIRVGGSLEVTMLEVG